MKKATIITIFAGITLLFASPTETVTITDDFTKMETQYVVDLNHQNHGVVESALYCIINLKVQNPDRQFVDISRTVNRLARSGDTPAIRYKANLAKMILDDPEYAKCLKGDQEKCEDGPEFWTKLVANVPFAYDV